MRATRAKFLPGGAYAQLNFRAPVVCLDDFSPRLIARNLFAAAFHSTRSNDLAALSRGQENIQMHSHITHVDLPLARRLEMAEAEAARACADAVLKLNPRANVAHETIAGGIAVFTGKDSPITQAVGVGLHGPVSEDDIDRVTRFFHSRGAASALELCPVAGIPLYELLAKRGYQLLEVSNVLLRPLSSEDRIPAPPPHVAIRPAAPSEADLWTRTVAAGFAEHFPVTDALLDVMNAFSRRSHAVTFLAFIDDQPAGGAVVSKHAGVAGLFGASTLPAFRRRGVQSALLSVRLEWALAQGCDVAVSIALPGSDSQRNIERLGFQVAYTRTKLVLNCPPQ